MEINNLLVKKRGRPAGPKKQKEMAAKDASYVPKIINFDKVRKLNDLKVDPRMMMTAASTIIPLDKLISYEGGLPAASNLMFGGDPGVGKTTILLDYGTSLQNNNKNIGYKVLFISGEMGRKQMYKYKERFPQFNSLQTLFGSDFIEENMKDVVEQIFAKGWDCIIIDSIVEVLAAVRDDMDWDKKQAEKWFVSQCQKQNNGENEANKFTSFMAIQQLNASNGEFVGGNKIKYLFDSAFKITKDKKTGSTSIMAEKNRNGVAHEHLFYTLNSTSITYTKFEGREENEDEEKED
jgi:DNA repair protein RadA/Sms